MNIQTIYDEPERGCGFRKEGGMYLVSGGSFSSCGKLPLEMAVCPTCGQGIKPARGFTWVDAVKLFRDGECKPEHRAGDCEFCILSNPNLMMLDSMMGLIWIGSKHYPTAEDFGQEAMKMGISRRISAIPKDFVVGETWVLFGHRQVIEGFEFCLECEAKGFVEHPESSYRQMECPECNGAGKVQTWKPAIFGVFKPERIEYIVKEDDTEEKLDRLEKRGITLIKLVRTIDKNGNGVLDLEGHKRQLEETEVQEWPEDNKHEVIDENYEAEAELRQDRILDEQEREDFAHDGDFENMPLNGWED